MGIRAGCARTGTDEDGNVVATDVVVNKAIANSAPKQLHLSDDESRIDVSGDVGIQRSAADRARRRGQPCRGRSLLRRSTFELPLQPARAQPSPWSLKDGKSNGKHPLYHLSGWPPRLGGERQNTFHRYQQGGGHGARRTPAVLWCNAGCACICLLPVGSARKSGLPVPRFGTSSTAGYRLRFPGISISHPPRPDADAQLVHQPRNRHRRRIPFPYARSRGELKANRIAGRSQDRPRAHAS